MSASDEGAEEPTEPRYRDEQWLREQYWDEYKTTDEIGQECGVSPSTVRRWMIKHDIDRRDPSEARTQGDVDKLRDEGWLREQYCSKHRTAAEIGDECDLHSGTVLKWLDKHGIERRNLSESRTMGDIEKLQDEKWLRERYNEVGSTVEIAAECGVSQSSVVNYLERHGIEAEYGPESPLTGEDHPRWNGGSSHTNYGPSWDTQRQKALDRDGNQCLVCGRSDAVHVHHIRPFRTFGLENHEEANVLDNLVCLCPQHHVKWEGIPLRPQTD